MSQWIEYGDSFSKFREAGLNAPGTVIDVNGVCFLIGDINRQGGYCACCSEVDDWETVIRYMTLEIVVRDLNKKEDQ